MAITFPLVTLADGALISKTFIDAVVDDINHLTDRPDAMSVAFGSATTATSTTFVQLSSPSVTITPKRTGNILIIGEIVLASSVANDQSRVQFDVNGTNVTDAYMTHLVANQASSLTLFHIQAVTADVAYTIKLEFNRSSGSGTVTHNLNGFTRIYAIEVGA